MITFAVHLQNRKIMPIKDKHTFALTLLESFGKERCCADCGAPIFIMDRSAQKVMSPQIKHEMDTIAEWRFEEKRTPKRIRCSVCESL